MLYAIQPSYSRSKVANEASLKKYRKQISDDPDPEPCRSLPESWNYRISEGTLPLNPDSTLLIVCQSGWKQVGGGEVAVTCVSGTEFKSDEELPLCFSEYIRKLLEFLVTP